MSYLFLDHITATQLQAPLFSRLRAKYIPANACAQLSSIILEPFSNSPGLYSQAPQLTDNL